MKRAVLIDGYIDEPAALGVPPYISPYVRYVYGALRKRDFDVSYPTIDEIRAKNHWNLETDPLVVYGGVTVPGHYLSGSPITLSEVRKIVLHSKAGLKIIGGPLTRTYTLKGGTISRIPDIEGAIAVRGDLWAFLDMYLSGGKPDIYIRDNYALVNELAIFGAELIRNHPKFPNVICEVEVSRGCERMSFCSFCTEPLLHGRLRSRDVEGILKEIEALCKAGCRAFRLGRSANILAYMAEKNNFKVLPEALLDLYTGIRNACPSLEVLHTDNANPSFIVSNLPESLRAIETIAKHNTPGDILSFGAESFDPAVTKANNIGSKPEDVKKAIEIVNEIGGFREGGIPKLLPGINILYGLIGESEKTYEMNYRFLKDILEEGLLLRRINIRQVMVHPGTPLHHHYKQHKFKLKKHLFKQWKDRIRREVDLPMMKKVFPKGTVIRGVIPEEKRGKLLLARPLATYPVLIGTYSKISQKSDVIIVNHGGRSLTGVKYPFDVNNASYEELTSIEGIGDGRAREIIMKRPFKDIDDMENKLEKETWEALKDIILSRV